MHPPMVHYFFRCDMPTLLFVCALTTLSLRCRPGSPKLKKGEKCPNNEDKSYTPIVVNYDDPTLLFVCVCVF